MKKFLRSFHYACEGVYYAFTHNLNLQVHFVIALLVMLISLLLNIKGFEMGILGIMILLVIAAEMVNCALEEMVNLITTEHRKEAKQAKDVAAGMVLMVAIGSVIIAVLIFVPHIFSLLHIKH
jgi:diacylglycerol kinase